MIVLSTLSTKLISGVINLLALNLCTALINYDLPFFSAINNYFFSRFKEKLHLGFAANLFVTHIDFPLVHAELKL